MIRFVVWLAILVLSGGRAWAEGSGEALPLEVQWLKVAAQVISTVGMPGVIGGLLYLLRMQKADREKEREALLVELAEERAYVRKLQADRVEASIASTERMATVAVSGSAAISGNTSATAELVALVRATKEVVAPLSAEHARIIANQEGLASNLSDLSKTVGQGCRA